MAESSDWKLIDVRRKLRTDLQLVMCVTPYDFGVCRNIHTGRKYYTEIPADMHNEISYGENLKAAAFLAHTEYNVPVRSVREYLPDISEGAVRVSHGFITGLTEEFALRSKEERDSIIRTLLSGRYMHIDTTTAQCESGRHHVTVNVNSEAVYLGYSHHKGMEAAEKTPYAMGFDGCGIHDGEATFDHFVPDHQQCHAHLIRCLQDVVENEPDKKRAPCVKKLLQQLVHDRKSWPEDGPTAAYKKRIRAALYPAD